MRNKTIRLGLMPPLTGVVGIYGVEIARAGQIACAEVNESGGVLGRPLELVIEDDGSLPNSAIAAATRLLDYHRCAALIGNLLSNSRIAIAYQVAEPRRIPYLNFSFYEGSILSHYFFHFAALPNQQIDKMIPYMHKRYGPRMFFAGNNYEWPRGSIDAAKRALAQSGGQTVGEAYYPIGVDDNGIEALLDQVTAANTDVFVPYFAGIDQIRLLSRFTDRGLKSRMAVVMGHYDEIMASRLLPQVRAGFYSSNTYFMTLATPENQAYLARLAALPGVSGVWPHGNGILTNFGEGAYLCVKAFAQAANQAASLNPEALVDALATIRVSGPQGAVQMDPVTHHAQVNTYLSRCQADGSFAIIEQFGAIPPALPERYRHLRIIKQSEREDIYLQSRMMAQMSEAVLLVHATNGAIVYANPGAERMFGYSSNELANQCFSVLFAPTDPAPQAIGEALSQKGVWQGETEHVASYGQHFWCAMSASVFTHPKHGEVWLLLGKDITERKQAETALRFSEERFRKLVKVAPIPLCYVAKNGVIQDFNDRFAQVFGYTHADIPTLDEWWPLAYPDANYRLWVQDTWNTAVQAASETRQDIRPVEYNVTCKNGDVRIMEISGVTLGDDFLATFIDLTARKHAEEQLRSASQYARSLIEASLDPLVTISAQGKITDVNEAAVHATGVTRNALIGSDFSDYFTEPEQARSGYRQVFAKGFVTDYPLSLRHVSGRVTEVLYNASVYRNARGEVAGVFAAARDITERKEAERATIQLNLRNRLILDSAGEGIYGLDLNGRCTFINPAASQLLGFAADEIVGQHCHRLFHHSRRDGSPYPPEECPVLSAYQQGAVHRGEDWYWRKEGTAFPVEFISTPIREAGKITGAVVAFSNIAERKRVERELSEYHEHLEELVRERTEKLEAANRDLEGFAYSVSHDLRVPLRAIDGFSHQLLKRYLDRLDSEGQRYLNIVRDNAKRMSQLIDDILAFSRMGRLGMSLSEIDMERLAGDVFDELKAGLAGRELTLTIAPLPPCRGDAAMLRQVWINLMANAIKFTRHQAMARVEIGGHVEGPETLYCIKDNGAGFDMQYADKLFGVFQRLHGVEEFDGTGIGLAIVKRIVTRHGGRVWAEGQVDAGATFYFSLPTQGEQHDDTDE